MTFRYEIHPEARAIVLHLTGKFTLGDLIANVHALWRDARYSPTFDGLVDLTAADLGVEMSDFRPLLDYVRQSPHTSKGRWAAVADSPLATACGLLYRKAVRSRHFFEVFSTREAACQFVGFKVGSGDLLAAENKPRR